jgi:DNA-binding response OmpR family regulator
MARILVVDDDPLIIRLVGLIFSTAGYEVDTACDGLEGLELLSSRNPDLVLCDLSMPNMDGEGLFRLAQQNRCEVPIIVFTALNASQKARELGAVAYVQKPFDPDELLAVVDEVLRTHATL